MTTTLKPRLHDTTGCQTGCQTGLRAGLTTVLNNSTVRSTGCQPALYNRFDKHGLTTGCIHDTTVCQIGFTTGLTTVLTTGCIV